MNRKTHTLEGIVYSFKRSNKHHYDKEVFDEQIRIYQHKLKIENRKEKLEKVWKNMKEISK